MSVIERLLPALGAIPAERFQTASGRVTRFDGQVVECHGFPVSVGAICAVEGADGSSVDAEVIGFREGRNLLFLHEFGARIEVGARVRERDEGREVAVGDGLLGRVVDARGEPLDNGPAPVLAERWPLLGRPSNPLGRAPVAEPLDVGVRVVNALLTIGRGQRVGIVAGSGVGKSVLLSMMTRFSEADVIVVGLIGERGREVGSFYETVMRAETRGKVCIVAVPADRSPLLRIRGANYATAIAEYFRDKGKNVLLIMDSLTRVAHARREVGLALGEQPTAKGYPPSVVSMIPCLVERSGTGPAGGGSITALYTVLADGDDTTADPVVDTARAILDGHIVLSRKQTQLGIYPAVDIGASVSRVMGEMMPARHIKAAAMFRRLVTLYLENRDLMLMGGYTPGQDADLDLAVALWPKITAFVGQAPDEPARFAQTQAALYDLVAG